MLKQTEDGLHDCANFLGCSPDTLRSLILEGQPKEIKDLWATKCLRESMAEISRTAKVREDVAIKSIMSYAKSKEKETNVGRLNRQRFQKLVREDWQIISSRFFSLPTRSQVFIQGARDAVLASLESKVKANTSIKELTQSRLISEAINITGYSLLPGEWLGKPLRAAIRRLKASQQNQVEEPPTGLNIVPIRGGWVDLDSDQWDLRNAQGGIIRRNDLRPDLADIAWPRLQEEFLSGSSAIITIEKHYQGYILAGKLLSKEVPDIRTASLEAVQRAWHLYDKPLGNKRFALYALKSLFINLVNSIGDNKSSFRKEYFRIAVWLCLSAKIQNKPSDGDFLSVDEMEKVIICCMNDINNGISFIKAHPEWTEMSTSSLSKINASAVSKWTTALAILLMLFTGLRPQSVKEIKIGDWVEILPRIFALAWHHDRCLHEDVVAVSADFIELLQIYMNATEPIRNELQTDYLFLTGNNRAGWQTLSPDFSMRHQIQSFVKRHSIERNGHLIALNATMFRRTYATQELYRGTSIKVIQRQLGHLSEQTTKIYLKFDLFEHPAYVNKALDHYGMMTLVTWNNPIIIDDLDADERAALFANRVSREQDVGFCRHDNCVKINRGGPPPCSLCDRLATGPEFLNEWEDQLSARLSEIERLSSIPSEEHALRQKQHELALFRHNYDLVRQRCKND